MGATNYAGIAAAADMRIVVAACGLEVNAHDKAVCPFHADTRPSLHIYRDGYKCFVCGAHGDAIDLVQGVKGCSKREAAGIVQRLNGGAADDIGAIQARRTAAKQLEADTERRAELDGEIDSLHSAIAASVPYSPQWCAAYAKLDRLLWEYDAVDGRIVRERLRIWEEKHNGRRGNSRP